MKIGAEPKKLAILGGLVLVGGYFFYSNVLSDPSSTHTPPPSAVRTQPENPLLTPDAPAARTPVAKGPVRRGSSRARATEDFRPSMKRRPEDAVNPMTIDPTLRLDLLAKVHAVDLAGGSRNPFQFSSPPAPPIPPTEKVVPGAKLIGPKPAEPPKSTEPAKPAGPPPLNLTWKYYGDTSVSGEAKKKAFFLDGEEILTAAEGEVVKRKYRVVRIGVNSVVMEDTETKSQQTLPLQEEALG
jgi:hypothetical protein